MFKNFLRDEQGGIVEYLILLCAIAVASVLIFPSLRSNLVSWNNDSVHNTNIAISGKPSSGDNQWTNNGNNNNNGSGSVVTPQQTEEFKVSFERPTGFEGQQLRIYLTPSTFDYSKVKADGSNLSFMDEKKNVLPLYIEKWNTKGESLVWVKTNKPGTKELTIQSRDNQITNNPNLVFDFYEDFSKPLDPKVWLIPPAYSWRIEQSNGKLRITKGIISLNKKMDLKNKTIRVRQSMIETPRTFTLRSGLMFNNKQLNAADYWLIPYETTFYSLIKNDKTGKYNIQNCTFSEYSGSCYDGRPAEYNLGEEVEFELFNVDEGSYYKQTETERKNNTYVVFTSTETFEYIYLGYIGDDLTEGGTIEYDKLVITTGDYIKTTVTKVSK
ncbi:DUF2341 domain-containing protein [Bacillus cereus]|uniref:DUF2341 domain-containing protein n=1 Tax=Bacillus cereus TaxID=1396 RepID=UPI00159629C2|nr:DUF2341 domain-containing protein [Bacillus cereus]